MRSLDATSVSKSTASWIFCTSNPAALLPISEPAAVGSASARHAVLLPMARSSPRKSTPRRLSSIQQRAQREHLRNITTVLGTPDDPKLSPNTLDAALMLKVYHEIAHPPLVLASLRAALKPGARFGIIDRNGKGDDHGLNEPIVRAEVERAGFRQVARYDFTKADGQDYFLIFEKR